MFFSFSSLIHILFQFLAACLTVSSLCLKVFPILLRPNPLSHSNCCLCLPYVSSVPCASSPLSPPPLLLLCLFPSLHRSLSERIHYIRIVTQKFSYSQSKHSFLSFFSVRQHEQRKEKNTEKTTK